ncbi:unnamed protein product [Discosporangium mesarthrocarpum]
MQSTGAGESSLASKSSSPKSSASKRESTEGTDETPEETPLAGKTLTAGHATSLGRGGLEQERELLDAEEPDEESAAEEDGNVQLDGHRQGHGGGGHSQWDGQYGSMGEEQGKTRDRLKCPGQSELTQGGGHKSTKSGEGVRPSSLGERRLAVLEDCLAAFSRCQEEQKWQHTAIYAQAWTLLHGEPISRAAGCKEGK